MSLPMTHNLADGETFKVKVFKDHPRWDTCAKWFMLPTALLNELYVCAYECDHPKHLDWIEKEHPGCVFVY